MPPAQPTTQQDRYEMNAAARRAIISTAYPVIQKVASFTQAQYPYTAGQATTINCGLLNVGLIKRVLLKISATVKQSAAETHTKTVLGPANFFSRIVFTDLNNQTRINTTGWHMTLAASARRQLAIGSAISTDSPLGFGNNYSLIECPTPLTTVDTLSMFYELPFSYSDTDMRGAVFAQVVNAVMNLQLTINPRFFAAAGADATESVYQSSTATLGEITSYTIDVYQEYWDQLPQLQDRSYFLPMIDLGTQYNFIDTALTGMAVNTPFSVPYQNFRDYLSTVLIYDNGGTLNAGTDIATFALQTANSSKLFEYDPFVQQLLHGRNKLSDDFPKGVYYFDTRNRPVSTLAAGNTELRFTPTTVNANAKALVGFEFLATQAALPAASSIVSQ